MKYINYYDDGFIKVLYIDDDKLKMNFFVN